jgi:hypothetical protein
MRLRGSPRARGTPGVRRTHGPQSVTASRQDGRPGRRAAVRILKPQVRLLSDVPRAVFGGLLRRPPGGRDLSGFRSFRELCSSPGNLPTALGFALARQDEHPARVGGSMPVIRGSRIGTLRLGPPGRGVRMAPLTSHSPATAGRSRLTTPREAPSDGPACR